MTLTGNPIPVKSEINMLFSDPLVMLQEWLKTADKLKISEPRGLVLSTVDTLKRPSSRVVLLKECDKTGVIFTSREESAKGRDLKLNPWAAGTLWWRETIQQINFQGKVTQLSNDIADKLFQERPKEAQAVAVASKQSALMETEEELRKNIVKILNSVDKIKRPEGWHAYHLTIESIEFWQGSQDRFHKRVRYDLIKGSWQHQRLQP